MKNLKNLLVCATLCIMFASCGSSTTSTSADTALPADGLNALVIVSPELAGANCSYGGQKIETGLDLNSDTILQPSEVTKTGYVCNGNNGATVHDALVFTSTAEPGNCNDLGGIKIETTVNLDDDLDTGYADLNPVEILNLNVFYVCNNALHNALVNVTDEFQGSNCPFGGKKIRYGLDTNGNGTLDISEPVNAIYVCSILQ